MAWCSGRAFNAFGNSVCELDDVAECTYSSPYDSSRRIALPFECGLLRLDWRLDGLHGGEWRILSELQVVQYETQ